MSIGSRLKKFIGSNGLTQKEFASRTGLTGKQVSQYIKDQVSPTSDNLVKIFTEFSDLNLHWLLTGQGEMLLSNKEGSSNSDIEDLKEEIKKLWAELKNKADK